MLQSIKINFDDPKLFEPANIKPLVGIVGLYFIFTNDIEITYPFRKSRLLYIGMSERRTNSIGSRLMGHYDSTSGNMGLYNYRKIGQLFFTHINFEMLKNVWGYGIENLESYFILDFLKTYGVYPICNNKTGFEITKNDLNLQLNIDWSTFEISTNG